MTRLLDRTHLLALLRLTKPHQAFPGLIGPVCLMSKCHKAFIDKMPRVNVSQPLHSVPLGFQNPDIQNERRRPKVNRVHYDAMRYTIQTIKYIYIIQPTNYIMNHLILCTQKHFTPPPFTPGSYEELPWGAASGLSRHHFFFVTSHISPELIPCAETTTRCL